MYHVLDAIEFVDTMTDVCSRTSAQPRHHCHVQVHLQLGTPRKPAISEKYVTGMT